MRHFTGLLLLSFTILSFLGLQVGADSLLSATDLVEGSGRQATEEREVSQFERLEVEGPADIVITSSLKQSVKVSADDNLLDMIETKVTRRGTLVIDADSSFDSRSGIKIEITTPVLKGIWAAGSGKVEIHDLAEKTFDVEVAGSGDVEINGTLSALLVTISGEGGIVYAGEADEVDVTVNGSGDVVLSGEAAEIVITISGSGDVNAQHMIAEEASVRVSSSGNVSITATDYFDGAVYDSGSIDVYGNPRHYSPRESGTGRITKH